MSSVIVVTKKDIFWSYIAKFLGIASGLIVLPFILNKLTPEEIGLNYLMLTIGSMVSLLDFGFSPQFGRNITYAFSGAKDLAKEGFFNEQLSDTPNYRLVATVILTAKNLYKKLSLFAFIIMLTGGTAYVYYVTNGFVVVKNSLVIWLLYSVSVYFNIYFSYYSSLLTGRGLIKDQSISIILSKLTYFALTIILIILNWGLISVVIANLVSPFIQLYYSHVKFYNKELKEQLPDDISNEEYRKTLMTIWYNAKKLGIVFVGAYVINKMNLFVVGLFLPLAETASYGLMVQIGTTMATMSSVLFVSYLPQFANFQVTKQYKELRDLLSASMTVFWVMMVCGSVFLFFYGDEIVQLIGSQTMLPNRWICLLFFIFSALELNQSNFATIIVTSNRVPIVKPTIISGVAIVLMTFVVLYYTRWGILGVVIVQAVVQLCYNDWKWPAQVLKELNTNFVEFVSSGFTYLSNKVKYAKNRYCSL